MVTDTAESASIDVKTLCRTLVSELPPPLRRLRVDTLADTLAHGVPASPLATAVVLSAIDDRLADPRRLTSSEVEALLWHEIADFCADHDIALPDGCAEALHAIVATGVRSEFFSPDADCPRQLFAPMQAMGLQPKGRRRRHLGA